MFLLGGVLGLTVFKRKDKSILEDVVRFGEVFPMQRFLEIHKPEFRKATYAFVMIGVALVAVAILWLVISRLFPGAI